MRIAIAIFTVCQLARPAFTQNTPGAMTVDDVVKLYKAGVSENVLVARIKQSNKPLQLSTDDLLKLAQEKVPDNVIQALMNPASPPVTTTSVLPNTAGSGRADANDTSAQPVTAIVNTNITVRNVLLSKAQIDSKKRELDLKSSKSPAPKRGGLAGRLGGALGNTLMGDANRRTAAETVLHQQAHEVAVREKKTAIVVLGGKDIVEVVQANLIDVKREVILLHLDPSVSDKTTDNAAIHDGLTGGLAGMPTNVWVYLPTSAPSAAAAKPDRTLSSKIPGLKQVLTAIFAADGDLPPEIENKLK
jgi:hypothetical protein